MCFENRKQLYINNCLADKLMNIVINLSLGSYLLEKQLNKHKETKYLRNNLNFVRNKLNP